jgi:hypothetical protein
MMVFTALLGFSGIMLNSRPFLAVYTFLLWVCLGLMVSPGYIAYKQRTFNLEGKINLQWSRLLGTEGRLRIQDAVSTFSSNNQTPHMLICTATMLRLHFALYRSIDLASLLFSIQSTRV